MASEKLRFWILDVNYEVVGEIPEIRLWGIDDKGNRVIVIDREFRPYFYVLPEKEEYVDELAEKIRKLGTKHKVLKVEVVERKFFGKPVKVLKVTCQIPAHVPYLREEVADLKGVKDVLEADIRFYMRYMADNDIYPSAWHEAEVEEVPNSHGWKVDKVYLTRSRPRLSDEAPPPKLRVFAFDIECYSPLGEPKPLRDPVIVISTMKSNGEVKIFSAKDKDDREVIASFVQDLKEYDPDIIVGYNSNRFDWPYLIERGKHLKVRLSVSRTGSTPAQSVYGHFSVVGRANVDLYDFAEEIPEVKVKTLENVADYLGVRRKSERVLIEGAYIYKYWEDGNKRKILLQYAKDDVESTYGLAEKFLPFAIQLSSIVGLTLDQVGAASVGNRVEWHLIRQAYKFNELVPNRVERPFETYKGAIVLKPKPGIHKNVVVLDFSAMYPNIMISKNISPDTYVPPSEEVKEDEVYVAPEVGHRFRKTPPGFYKKVLERLLKAREEIRTRLKDLSPESPEYRILDERQRAIKIIANATYGYCGWLGARWYKREVAEATTAWGRSIITKTINYARSLGLNVIYGDTDSIFVYNDEEKINRLIEFVEKELGLEIKVDKVYDKIFFTEAKKRYCGLLSDGRIDVVGLEAVRGDWAELAKEVQEEVIEIVLKREDPLEAVEHVRSVIAKLREGKVAMEKLIVWKTLSKRIDEYEVKAAHVEAAKKLIEMGYEIGKGDKIGYIVCKGGGEKLATKVKPHILVENFDEVDVEYYVKKQIIPAALRILGYFGIKEDQFLSERPQKSLLEYF